MQVVWHAYLLGLRSSFLSRWMWNGGPVRWFFDARRGEGNYINSGDWRFRYTSHYNEVEVPAAIVTPQSPGGYFVIYIQRNRPGVEVERVVMQANVDRIFDRLLQPEIGPPETAELFLREVMRARPIFKELVENTVQGRFSPAAFTKELDPDDQTRKVFVVKLIGNLSITDTPDRLSLAAAGLMVDTYNLLMEWKYTPIDLNHFAQEASSAEIRRDLKNALRWLDDSKETLIKALKPW